MRSPVYIADSGRILNRTFREWMEPAEARELLAVAVDVATKASGAIRPIYFDQCRDLIAAIEAATNPNNRLSEAQEEAA